MLSSGEQRIGTFLSNHNIKFKKQKQFSDCKYKRSLRFDFYIPAMNTVIEYQGIQHFEPIDFFGGEIAFQELQRRDKIKKEYCVAHCINYVAISYKEDVETVLLKMLSNEDIVYPHGNMVG